MNKEKVMEDKPTVKKEMWGSKEFSECFKEFSELIAKPEVWNRLKTKDGMEGMCDLANRLRRFVMWQVAIPGDEHSPMPKSFPFIADEPMTDPS